MYIYIYIYIHNAVPKAGRTGAGPAGPGGRCLGEDLAAIAGS